MPPFPPDLIRPPMKGDYERDNDGLHNPLIRPAISCRRVLEASGVVFVVGVMFLSVGKLEVELREINSSFSGGRNVVERSKIN